MNAALNAASAIFLTLGWVFIRQRAVTAHTVCMTAACGTSALFLISYISYHLHHGSMRFQGPGLIRPVYFAVLISHTILAVVIVPLVVKTLARGLRGHFQKHVAIARITLPLWLYVSVTGIAVYWLLYRL